MKKPMLKIALAVAVVLGAGSIATGSVILAGRSAPDQLRSRGRQRRPTARQAVASGQCPRRATRAWLRPSSALRPRPQRLLAAAAQAGVRLQARVLPVLSALRGRALPRQAVAAHRLPRAAMRSRPPVPCHCLACSGRHRVHRRRQRALRPSHRQSAALVLRRLTSRQPPQPALAARLPRLPRWLLPALAATPLAIPLRVPLAAPLKAHRRTPAPATRKPSRRCWTWMLPRATR
jgi:hypothetical protein